MKPLGNRKFGVFIKALHKEAGDRQDYFVSSLFESIGAEKITDVSLEDTVKNWVSGKNKSYKKYFKGKEFDQEGYNGFLQFIDENINVRFTNVQNSLEPYCKDYCYIDFKTDVREDFFASVLNQFMEIVGLPLPSTAVPFSQNCNEDYDKKQELESFNKTPTEQMRRLFERAVAEANIALHIRNLPDYLEDGLLCPQEVASFFDTMQTKIASGFIDQQDEELFQKIKEFNTEVRSYFALLGMIPPKLELEKPELIIPAWQQPIEPVTDVTPEADRAAENDVERYSNHWRKHQSYDGLFSLLNDARTSLDEKSKCESPPPDIEEKLTRLHFISSIFSAHKRICELFEEITMGKTLTVF